MKSVKMWNKLSPYLRGKKSKLQLKDWNKEPMRLIKKHFKTNMYTHIDLHTHIYKYIHTYIYNMAVKQYIHFFISFISQSVLHSKWRLGLFIIICTEAHCNYLTHLRPLDPRVVWRFVCYYPPAFHFVPLKASPLTKHGDAPTNQHSLAHLLAAISACKHIQLSQLTARYPGTQLLIEGSLAKWDVANSKWWRDGDT